MLINTCVEMQLFNFVLSRTHYMAHLGSTSGSAVLSLRPMDIQSLWQRIESDCATIHGPTYCWFSVVHSLAWNEVGMFWLQLFMTLHDVGTRSSLRLSEFGRSASNRHIFDDVDLDGRPHFGNLPGPQIYRTIVRNMSAGTAARTWFDKLWMR